MFGPSFGKAVRAALEQKLHHLQKLRRAPVELPHALSQTLQTHFTLATAANGQAFQSLASAGLQLRLGTAVLLGGGAAMALTGNGEEEQDVMAQEELLALPWVTAIAAEPGAQPVSPPSLSVRNHPIGKLVTKQDHLFGTMLAAGQLRSFTCFYNSIKREFHSVVYFGRDVCGYPQTVHGGLTAAVMDETLGGLGLSLWKAGALGFQPPPYTAHLEVNYKKKLSAGAIVHCSAEVESINDRKVWMRATMSDGEGNVYATARALFVSPRMTKLVPGWDAVIGNGGKASRQRQQEPAAQAPSGQ